MLVFVWCMKLCEGLTLYPRAVDHALHGTAAINHHFTKHTPSDLPLLLYI